MNRTRELAHDGTINEYPHKSHDIECLGIDDRALELFFRNTLQEHTLKSEITPK